MIPPPPPPRPFDQDRGLERPPLPRRIVVNDVGAIAAQYESRIRLLYVFSATFLLVLAVAGLVLAVRWLIVNPADYRDPEPPPASVPPPSG